MQVLIPIVLAIALVADLGTQALTLVLGIKKVNKLHSSICTKLVRAAMSQSRTVQSSEPEAMMLFLQASKFTQFGVHLSGKKNDSH